MPAAQTRGKDLADILLRNARAFLCWSGTATPREVIHGLNPRGVAVNSPISQALGRAREILARSGRVRRYENSLTYETLGDTAQLHTLSYGPKSDTCAAAILANLFVVSNTTETSRQEALPPPQFVAALLADEALGSQVPVINYYTRRPIFDHDWHFCGRGWHPGPGILVHSAVELDIPNYVPAPEMVGETARETLGRPDAGPGVREVLARLPRHLRILLGEFCWADGSDLANAVSALLTGSLANHFVDDPHPMFNCDGNQPETGKKLYSFK